MAERRDRIERQVQSLAQQLDEHAGRLRAMQQKADLYETRVSERSSSGLFDDVDNVIRDEDVEVAFLREKQRRASR